MSSNVSAQNASSHYCTIVHVEILADTNVFLAVVLNEPQKEQIIDLTAEASAVAPDVLPYEIGNALSAMVKRRQVSESEALEAEKRARRIPVRLVEVDVPASLQLALEHHIYAYDAYFLHCAKKFAAPLLTLDRRMKLVAAELKIRLLETET